MAGEAWRGYLKILSLDARLLCRGAGSQSAFRWGEDRDGGAHQVGNDSPGYACHGSRPDRDTGSVELLVLRPLEYGVGFRGHRPAGCVSRNPVCEPIVSWGGDRFLRDRYGMVVPGLRGHQPGLSIPMCLHLVVPPATAVSSPCGWSRPTSTSALGVGSSEPSLLSLRWPSASCRAARWKGHRDGFYKRKARLIELS